VDDATDADVVLRELVQVAARARDDQAAAFAWTNLIFTLDADEARPAEAAELVPMATAAVLRAGDPPDLRADLLYTQAGLDIKPGRPDARRLLAEARRVLEQAGAASAGSPLASRLIKVIEMAARVHLDLGEHEAGIASYREVIERWRALYGPDSPDEAIAWHNLATGLDLAGERDEALAAYRRALAIREARLGESTATAFSSELVAMALHTRGRWSEALEAHDQAIRAYRAHLAPDDRQLIRTRGNRAETLGFLGRFDEAARAYDEILAELARIGPKAPDLPVMLHGRGELERRRGRCPDAVRDFARAIALGEELEGPGAPSLLHPLIGSARCLLRAGRLDDAAARAERALRLPSYPTDAFEIALARSYLGRVRVETRRDVAGGLAMARSARTALAAASDATNAEDVRELDAWLAAHGR
jgi:tetratricopeptide (TPR) repeat protein